MELQQPLPFTVLKRGNFDTANADILSGLQQPLPFTVLKHSAKLISKLQENIAKLQQPLPFTVLKLIGATQTSGHTPKLQQPLPFTVLKQQIRHRVLAI